MAEYAGALVLDTEGATNIKPKNLTNPWRKDTFSWTWTPAVAGSNNTITYHRIQRNIYRHATSTWDGWVQVKQVGAVTGTQTTTITLDNLNDLDCVRLRIVVVQGTGNNVTTYEAGTWSGITGTHTYQTQNAVPPAPIFGTESPLEILNNICNITLSAKDPSTSYFTTSNKKGELTFYLVRDNVDQDASVINTYTSTFSTTFDIYDATAKNYVGKTVTFEAAVNDGFGYSPTAQKTYRIGKNLEAASLTGSGSLLATGTANYKLVTSPAKIDNNSIAATTNYTLQASYSSSSGFKDIKTNMPTTSSGFTITSSKTITDVLGAPSKYTTKVYFRVKVVVSGYTTAYSNIAQTTFVWETINLENILINYITSNPRYRYNGGSPVGPCIYNSFTVTKLNNNVINNNVYYQITSGSASTTTTYGATSKNLSVTSNPPGAYYNITITPYQKMQDSNIVIALASKTLTNNYYKIAPLSQDNVLFSLSTMDVNFLSNTSNDNEVYVDINTKSKDNNLYRITEIRAILNAPSSTGILDETDSTNINIDNNDYTTTRYKIKVADSTSSGFCPNSNGYKISRIKIDNEWKDVSGGFCQVNLTMSLTVDIEFVELFASTNSNLKVNYTIEGNSTGNNSLSVNNFNTICEPNMTGFSISLGSE